MTLGLSEVHAGQYMGGEITYQQLSQNGNTNTYKIVVRINRNCKSFADFNAPVIWFFNNIPGFPHTKVFQLKPIQSSKQRLAVTKIQSCTINPPDICNDLYEFTGTIDLPVDPNGYLVYTSDCCRNAPQKNLLTETWNGGVEIVAGIPEPGASFTYHTRIPGTSTPVNSSPFPKTDSIIGACVGKPLQYKFDYQDPDGDELHYVIGDPAGVTTIGVSQIRTIGYANDFSLFQPFGMNSNLSIDPITGMLSGVPIVLGNYTICLDIQEWRNGVLINVHRREIELNVVDCKAVLNAIPVTCSTTTLLFNHANNSSLDYLWDFGVPEILTDSSTRIYPIYTYPTSGDYPVTLIVSNPAGCRDTVKTIAKVYDNLKVDFEWKAPICAGSPMQFMNLSSFGSGQITKYKWDHITVRGSNNFSNAKDPLYAYTYTDTVPLGYSIMLTITTDKGCTGIVTKVPLVYPKPSADAGRDTVIAYDLPYEMPVKSSLQNSYHWTPGTGLSDIRIANPTVTGGTPTCYTIKVWGKDSLCTSMDTVCIKYGRGPEVYLPTAFSPNGDGINDRLYVRAVQVQVTQIAIFNRWGQTVFNTNNSNQYWDGTYQGKIQVSGEYSWLVKGIGPGNKPFIKEGSISLLR